MGSYNVTCIASGQTIAEGDDVRVIFVRDASGLHGKVSVKTRAGQESTLDQGPYSVGVDAIWQAASQSFRGHYADYGEFNLHPDDRDRAKAFMKTIAPYLCNGHVNSSDTFTVASFDESIDDIDKCWRILMEASVRGSLFTTSIFQDGPRSIRLAAMHESAYRHLVDNAKNLWGPVTAAGFAEKIIEAVDVEIADPTLLVKKLSLIHSMCVNEALRQTYDGRGHTPFLDQRRAEMEPLIDAYTSDPTTSARALLIKELCPLLEDAVMFEGMNWLHLALMPSRYRGQDYSNELGSDFAKMVASVEQTVSALRKIDEDFEDEPPAP